MDKPKLTFREIIFEGIKKFAGEIIGVVLIACVLWFFPSLKSLFTEHTFPQQQEEERQREDLKRREEALQEREEALRAAEAKKAEEKADPPKVKADTTEAVKIQQDEHVKEVTAQAKQKSGAELLREVQEKYGPEDFFSAELNPKIFYDNDTKRPYVQIVEKFNQSVFWDEFLPKLRNALDGVAVKKTKGFYDDSVRKVNQTLNKQGYYDGWAAEPYTYSGSVEGYSVVITDNAASFIVYKMPFGPLQGSSYSSVIGRIINADDNSFKRDLSALMIYRSLSSNNEYRNILSSRTLSFAPGYIFTNEAGRNMPALDTENYNTAHPEEGCTVELDSDDLQRLDTMKFEVIFQ